MMFHLVYASLAVQPFSGDELLALLHKARGKNSRAGITGLLLYKSAAFMQVLEGEEQAVRALYAIVSKDPRHDKLITLLSAPATDRLFPDWSMGFQDLEGRNLDSVPGYNPRPVFPPISDDFPWKTAVAMRLLAGFQQPG